jgi:integrase
MVKDMATIELIRLIHRRPEVHESRVNWKEINGRKAVDGLPQIVWENGRTWAEANLWALEQATTNKRKLSTVLSSMTSLHSYAKWLEQEQINWWQFPVRESDRCLNLYRGALIEARDEGQIAPSTASARMAAVIRFYRWVAKMRLLSPEWPMWNDRQVGIRLTDPFGFEHTLNVNSTDLAIPNRKPPGSTLEDGLLPVSTAAVNAILAFAEAEASQELALMLHLGFFTGMRLGTIVDLKIKTIENAVPDPALDGWYRMAVGPGARPPVHTKFGTTGQIFIPKTVLDMLRAYIFSVRRLKRQSIAPTQIRQNVFLTRFGESYADSTGTDKIRAINVEMGRLRKRGVAAGVHALHDFHFHRSRCTFATELARVAIRHLPLGDAIDLVRQALLHKDKATTLNYIKFAQTAAAMAEAADDFTEAMMGLANRRSRHGA